MPMKAASDSNELVFTLRVAPHTRNASDLKSFGDMVIKEQKRIHDSASSFRTGKSPLSGFGMPDEKEFAKASAAQLRHQQRQAEAHKKALDKEQAEVKKAADQKIKEAKRVADAQIREVQRAAAEEERELDRQHQRHRQRQLSTARRNRTGREEQAAYNEARDERLERDRAGGAAGRTTSFNRRAEGVGNLIRGGGDIARGVAYSGLVGEKDSQKMLDTLLRMEGTLGLIYGALSIGKGLAALGPLGGAGAAAAAAVGYAGAGIYGLSKSPVGNYGKETQRVPWYLQGAQLYGRGEKGGFWDSDDDTDNAWRGFHEGVKRADSQEKYLSDRAKRGQEDAAEMGDRISSTDRDSIRRRVGSRGDDAEAVNIAKDLARLEADAAFSKERHVEAEKRNSTDMQEKLRMREDAEDRVKQKLAEQNDLLTKQKGQANDLRMSAAERVAGLTRSRLGEQRGLASDAVGRLRSDQVKFGGLDPLERMRTESAFAAMKSGRATREQEELAGGYNEFADQIEAARARRGESGWFSKGTVAADASVAEATRLAGELKAANEKVVVETKKQIEVKIVNAGGDEAVKNALAQIEQEMLDDQARESARLQKQIDDIIRERSMQQRNRATIAGR